MLIMWEPLIMQEPLIMREPESRRSWTSKVFNTVITLDTYQFFYQILNVSFFREVLNFAGTAEWAQLDLQSIQHRDYFGHLSIFCHQNYDFDQTEQLSFSFFLI